MISKKRALIYSIILVIVTIICTSMFQITLGNKVIISKNLYELYSKYDKLLGLENVIESEYYQKVSEEDLKNGIQYGAYNIREPKPECSPAINIKDLDVVIVPAVAYDNKCYRLGYGGGFYDRFLENLRKDAVTIGIAFDLQIFDEVPKEAHDAQLDYIVTESRILTPNKK